MSDDIVKRLIDLGDCCSVSFPLIPNDADQICKDAAAEIKRLRADLGRETTLRRAYRELPEQYHRGMLELLVKAAFEAAEISHGRAAELLGCSVYDIRGKGWVQGRMEEEVWRLTAHLRDIRRQLLHEDGTANVAEVQDILERALGVEE